jgi:hypothetical protein
LLVLVTGQVGRPPIARAQADPCPEPNNGFNTACFVGSASPTVQGYISAPDDVDAYKFQVDVPLAQVQLELSGLPADYDLHLFDTDSASLSESINVGLAPDVLDQMMVRGTYFVFVDSPLDQFDPGQPYSLTVRVAPLAGARPGLLSDSCSAAHATLEQACPITPGQLAVGALQDDQSGAFYRFDVPTAGSLITVRAGDVPADFTLTLSDAAGAELDHGTGDSTLSHRVDPGTYFAHVARQGGEPRPAPFELMVTVTPPNVARPAKQRDACPEPNDDATSACELSNGAALQGYIAVPNDTDVYHFKVDGGPAQVHLELTDLPRDYDLEIHDPAQTVLDYSHNSDLMPEAIDLQLDPGDYFALVYTSQAQSEDQRPYTMALSMVPAASGTRPSATVLFADNFNHRGLHFAEDADDDRYEVGYYDGEYVVKLHQSGTLDGVEEQGELAGVELADFQLDLDAHMTELPTECGGLVVHFRWQENGDGYELYVETVHNGGQGAASLSRFNGGQLTDLVPWTDSEAIKTGGQPNHVTIRANGDSLDVLINGQPVLSARDSSFPRGDLGLGAFTCDHPTEVRFDNLLAIPPGRSS